MEFPKIGTQSFVALGIGALLAFAVPIAIVLIWKAKKKEPLSTILIGAATFILFALILEKLIQNVLLFPTQMGLPENAVSRFLNVDTHPVLWAFVVGLFPGLFEETGRLVAFKTVLKKRTNRETSISYGIGHGCIEVILLLGMTYITYIAYAAMINTGTFGTVLEQVAEKSPSQVDAVYGMVNQIETFSFSNLGLGIVERVFAVLFHIGASILVFYACKDGKKFWLYPLAILLHTVMDFFCGLYLAKVFISSTLVLEILVALFGGLTFCAAYFLLYQKNPANP